ncbi:hypothetical protein MESS2_1220029 [Mesorhizobium metallidurans STM 2683]|uniref:Uncharacterized protein n=1 Tax=Mesorhizobium metallidurans STM 2683 TaxID=1297569 RepID=M5EIH7_9HYPH|nr:hypothetical protein MESS2_1220029 [Mesorhizobium metallidurans STM 2683]
MRQSNQLLKIKSTRVSFSDQAFGYRSYCNAKKPGEPGFFVGLLNRIERSETGIWCPEEDSNLHALRHTDLNRARLPIPPSGLVRAHVSGQALGVNALF